MNVQRVGIVGCGLIADTHVEAVLDSIPGVEISVCDGLNGKAELLRRKYNLKKSYVDFNSMLESEKPQSVHILTPPASHLSLAESAMRAGAHVLVEKPADFSMSSVRSLFDLGKSLGRTVCVDHSLLRQPTVNHAREIIRSTPGIQVLGVNSFYGLDADGFSGNAINSMHWKRSMPGGPIMDTLIHPISLLVELTGKARDIDVKHGKPVGGAIEDLLVTWNGEQAMGSITVSSNARPFRRQTEIVTNKLTMLIDHSTETLVVLDQGFGPKSVKKMFKNFTFGYQLAKGTLGTGIDFVRKKIKDNPGTRNIVREYYESIRSGTPCPVSEQNVLDATAVLEFVSGRIDDATRSMKAPAPQEQSSDKAESPPVERRILVTGASGFLGRDICEILSSRHYPVKAQVRRGANADRLISRYIKKVYDDFKYPDFDYDALVKNTDVVIHSAHAAGARTWDEYRKINADASLALYEAAARANCPEFIFISSVSVYGVNRNSDKPIDEGYPTENNCYHYDFYIRSKALAEKMLLERAQKGGPKLLIIRPGILYGKDGTRLARKSVPLKKTRLCIGFGNGKNVLPFTRADVLAQAICRIVDQGTFREGVYNFVGEQQSSCTEFIRERMLALGEDCRFVRLPRLPFVGLAAALELAYRLLGKNAPPPITRYVINSATRHVRYDNRKAIEAFGWDPGEAIAR